MKLSDHQREFAKDTVKLFEEIYKLGFSFTYGEAMRSIEQAEIYAKQGKGIINSLHCKRVAIDINLFNEKGEYLQNTQDYRSFGEIWELLDPLNRWGGRFNREDGNHFERNIPL